MKHWTVWAKLLHRPDEWSLVVEGSMGDRWMTMNAPDMRDSSEYVVADIDADTVIMWCRKPWIIWVAYQQ